MFEDPLIGMHGSFVVCQNAVEIDFGFDHGVEGSITEDTFFAMHIASHGVKVKWCEGHMFEQSPFNVEDFAKQRCRWYASEASRRGREGARSSGGRICASPSRGSTASTRWNVEGRCPRSAS